MQRQQSGNLSGTERAWSTGIGAALSLLVLRRGNLVLRSLAALAGLGLLARAAAGHCAVKAAVTGKSSIGQGFRDQWQSLSGRHTSAGREALEETQEYVEERADPTAVQEEPASSASAASSAANAEPIQNPVH